MVSASDVEIKVWGIMSGTLCLVVSNFILFIKSLGAWRALITIEGCPNPLLGSEFRILCVFLHDNTVLAAYQSHGLA